MLTLFDYLPSQNAWKIRQLIHHLSLPHRTVLVSIFEGEARTLDFLRINPTGKVPAIQLDDGRALAESNAILAFLADGTPYLPSETFARAKVHQWLSFEQEQVEATMGSLRYWTMTGKLQNRAQDLVDGKRVAAIRSLGILDRELSGREFIAGENYTIADISIYAYASRAEEAELSLTPFPAFRAWLARVRSQPGFLPVTHPYSIDPYAAAELP